MTRYGFSIKALSKPFKADEDEDEQQPKNAPEDTSPDGAPAPAEPPAAPPAKEPVDAQPASSATPPGQDAATPFSEDDSAMPPADDATQAPSPPPTDDARPWSGDMYDEGDETDPADAFAAYTGTGGEEAWLDQAPDGTLTGWVRDATGQVWRYSDADAWAVDVDDAQMTRTHSRSEEPDIGAAPDSGEQEPLFPPQ
ncbi:hypothetical protein ACPCTO_32065 [Streptomyces olivoreticuli]